MLALIALSVAALAAVTLAAVLLARTPGSDPVPPGSSQVATPSDQPSPPGPSTEPSSGEASQPPGRRPDSRVEDTLVRHPFYTQVLAEADCTQAARPLPDSRAGYERYLGALIGCTGDAFAPLLERSGFTLSRPILLIYAGTVSTPCGESPPGYAVFYCPGNETIYATVNALNNYGDGLRLAGYYIVFHEYAHHLQGELEILRAAYSREMPEFELSRRIELQADCWMGMTTRAMRPARLTDTDRAEMRQWRIAAADDTHGSTAAQLRWVYRGFDTAATDTFATCSTWEAPEPEVR